MDRETTTAAVARRKVLLIGWDAADWRVIHPLLDAGQLPTLERLIGRGVMGNLATLQPMLSPMLWTSIATGQRAGRHGIGGFVEPRPDGAGVQPVTSTSRRVKALWNVLSQNGLRCQTVGWFASHPAEPLPGGVSVSNLFAGSAAGPLPAGSVHPARLAETLAALRVHPEEITGAHLQPFVPRAAGIDQSDPAARKPLLILARLLAECASIQAAATHLLAAEPWDFAAVYYDAIDHFCHAFMPFHPPRMPGIDARLFALYRDVVGGVYRFHDMMLARLLELAGEDATVLLVSDHGFHSDHLRPGANGDRAPAAPNPLAWHRPHGVFILAGPGIRADERISGATLLDIAPTVLALFGLPAGEDMAGRALTEAFVSPPAPLVRLPSWEMVPGDAGLHPAELRADPFEAHAALAQLVDLGYLAPPGEEDRQSVAAASADTRFNLAQSALHGGQLAEAVRLLDELGAEYPGDQRFALSRAQAHLAAGNLAQARRLIEGALARSPGGAAADPRADLWLGILLLAENRPRLALARLRRAERANPRLPRLHNQLGAVYLRCRQWRAAERAFRRAARIDPDSAAAACGLAAALLRQEGRAPAAARWALRAAGLQHGFPAAHFQLGRALVRLGDGERAAQALEIALAMRPASASVHRYLAGVYRRLRQPEEEKRHRHLSAGARSCGGG